MKRSLACVLFVVLLSSCAARGDGPAPSWLAPRECGKIDQAWRYVSYNSAAIYWQTESPATGYVEYGESDKYGKKTTPGILPPREFFKGVFDRPCYTQFHRLTGLEAGKTYHYRTVSIGTGGKEVRGEGQTLTTKKLEGVIRIPQDVPRATAGDAAFILPEAGKTYVLTEDISADATAIRITGKQNVTLDLNGHTVTYNNKPGLAYGVQVAIWNRLGIKVVNGAVIQGKGAGANSAPIRARSARNMEVAGMELTYAGPDCHGIDWREARGAYPHHNVIFDRGTHITNRHQGLDAIHGGVKSDHNLVLRCRHRGIKGGSECAFNEIYMDSWATNAMGVSGGFNTHDNRIFGTGYIAVGIGYGWGDSLEPKRIVNNRIEMVGRATYGRSTEYSDRKKAYCNLAGLRVTQYHFRGENYLFEGNVVFINAAGATKARGLWISPTDKVKDLVFRDNHVEVLAGEGTVLDKCQAVSICGEFRPTNKMPPVVLEGNTIVSNLCNIRFAESYGSGSNVQFIRNRLVRVGRRDDYAMIRCGWWVLDTFGHVFRDSSFEGGAGFDTGRFEGGVTELSEEDARRFGSCSARRDFTVEWTLTVTTVPEATVTITDATGKQVFRDVTGRDGRVSAAIPQLTLEGDGPYNKGGFKRSEYTPHSVKVEKDGKTATRDVVLDGTKTIHLPL